MPIRSWVVSLCVLFVCAGAGCSIENCERGATCLQDDDDDDEEYDAERACVGYCGRLSVCGAPQARDFDDCVSSCRDRFEVLPQQTAKLCACAEQSTCSDVMEGRCTEPTPPHGNVGGSSGGGSTSTGGTPTGAGAASCPNSGSCPAGGAANTAGAGSSGASSSGAPNNGSSGSADSGAAGACD